MTTIPNLPHDQLRRDLAEFLGDGEFRKFVGQLRRASRFLYWQEQALEHFAVLHPGYRIGFDELSAALRICEIHGGELQPDAVEVARGWHIRLKPYQAAKTKLFPNAAFGPVFGSEEKFPDRIARVWYCPACRRAEMEWRGRHNEMG